MEREKNVEEMVKDISVILGTKCLLNIGGHCIDCKYFDEDNADHDCQSVLLANELTEMGYRKIPDGAVVLLVGKNNQALDERTIEYFVKHNAEVRKETAREIFHTLKGLIREPWKAYELTIDDLREIAEKYGLEVDE